MIYPNRLQSNINARCIQSVSVKQIRGSNPASRAKQMAAKRIRLPVGSVIHVKSVKSNVIIVSLSFSEGKTGQSGIFPNLMMHRYAKICSCTEFPKPPQDHPILPKVAQKVLTDFGIAVKRARSLKGWTHGHISNAMDGTIGKSFLSNIEKGKRAISAPTVGRLIKLYPSNHSSSRSPLNLDKNH